MSMSRRLQPAASSSSISPASSIDGTAEPPGAAEASEADEEADETVRSPSRNRREDRISSLTRLGVLYLGPRSRYSARSSASVARRVTYAPKSFRGVPGGSSPRKPAESSGS